VYNLIAGRLTTVVLRITGLRLTGRFCAKTSVAPNAKNIAKIAVKTLKLKNVFISHLFLFVYQTKLDWLPGKSLC
jgi:hypothetical protein